MNFLNFFSQKKPTTRDFLPIKEIKNGVVILKQGGWRRVLIVSSINFDLMSGEEREAVIFQFQNFLNSLDFEIQIVVQSRKLSLKKYIKNLEDLQKKQDNELLEIQTEEYKNFIIALSEMANLISKNFYIVVPFYPPVKEMNKDEFLKWRSQLDIRCEYIINGLRPIGINAEILESEELVELFWSFYNPNEAEKETIPVFPKIE